MKKIVTYIIISYLPYFCFSQNIKVEYNVKISSNIAINTLYELKIEGVESIYYKKDSTNPFQHEITEKTTKEKVQKVKLSDNHYGIIQKVAYYKNYQNDTLMYNNNILFDEVIIGEAISLFSWSIVPNSDTTLLGHKCQKATTDFRGRKYTAYFSKDLWPRGGPWKFDGLPGLILYVHSTDNFFVINATKIILNQKFEPITNPYVGVKKILSWEQYRKETISSNKRILQKLKAKSEPGDEIKIKTESIEDMNIKEESYIKE